MTLSKTDRFRILQRDRFTCRYCGRCPPAVVLEVDHVHPRSEGGSDDPDNLVSSCLDCNRGKGARLLPVPGDTVVVIDGTVPHPDTCATCSDEFDELRSYAAVREEPRGTLGYAAFYRCDRGHEWSTYWQACIRLSVFGAQAAIAEFNAAYSSKVPA